MEENITLKIYIRQNTHSPGTEVPRATNTTAVTESFRPTVQPKWEARSPATRQTNTSMAHLKTNATR